MPTHCLPLLVLLYQLWDRTKRQQPLCEFCQHELTAVQPWQNISNTCLNQRTKLIRWCTLREHNTISILVKVTLMESWSEMTCDRGWKYSVNKAAPRMDPRGTPYTRGLGPGERQFLLSLIADIGTMNHELQKPHLTFIASLYHLLRVWC